MRTVAVRNLSFFVVLLVAVVPSSAVEIAALSVDDGPLVVQLELPAQSELDALAAWADLWAVMPEQGIAVLEVDRDGFRRLVASGFRFTVDARRTGLLRRVGQALPGQQSGIPGYPCYRTVEETFDSAVAMVAAHPELASWHDIGDSWEKTANPQQGYDIRALRLTRAAVPGPKPRLYVNAAIHAREYATAELATRFAEWLLARYGVDADVTWILDHHEIIVVPQFNPDGRKRAETGLSWRKNADNDFCGGTNNRGVDLNRNFEFEWNCCGGSSGYPCDPTFHGPWAGSEPETMALQEHVRSLFPDQRPDPLNIPAPDDSTGIFLDLHAFGEDVLWPWSFSTTQNPNGAQFYTLGRKVAFFNGYRPQHGSLYIVDGATKDFTYGELGVPGFTIELGTDFFESCASFEGRVLPDNLASLLYSAKVARTPYLTPAGPEVVDPLGPSLPVTAGDLVAIQAIVDDTRYSTANGVEPTQIVSGAELFLGEPPWSATAVASPMIPSDGSFDEKVEAVEAQLDISGLAPGIHLVYLQGIDVDANRGAVSAVFLPVIDPVHSPVIEGTVRDAIDGQPLQATVAIGSFPIPTDPATGFYQLRLPSGTYAVTATADGYQPQTLAEVSVADDETRVLDFDLVPFVEVLHDDVEGGNSGWTAQAPWAITDEASASPTHSWTDSPGAPYGDGIDVSLTSPLVDLGGLEQVDLVFHHIYDIEQGYDEARVEVSADGGASWSLVALYTGEDQTAEWMTADLPVPQLDGAAAARIRFRLLSDSGVHEDGWHLDDIVLRGVPAGQLFRDGFESGEAARWSSVAAGL